MNTVDILVSEYLEMLIDRHMRSSLWLEVAVHSMSGKLGFAGNPPPVHCPLHVISPGEL